MAVKPVWYTWQSKPLTILANGNYYWVDAGGSFEMCGTFGEPFRTVSYALKLAKPGDTILLKLASFEDAFARSPSPIPGLRHEADDLRPIGVEDFLQ